MISSNVAVNSHHAEVVWNKPVNRYLIDKFGNLLVHANLSKYKGLIISGEMFGSIIINALSLRIRTTSYTKGGGGGGGGWVGPTTLLSDNFLDLGT